MQPDETQQDSAASITPAAVADSLTNAAGPVVSDPTSQPNGSTPSNLPPEASESPIDTPTPIPVEDQNGGVNRPESDISGVQKEPENVVSSGAVSSQPAPTPQTPQATQVQPSAQFDQAGFVKSLLIKAQAKIQFNKQKKLEKIMVLAQKKKIITNDDIQKLLYVSDATATRYLVKLVAQGRLGRAGNPRDAKYQFVR
jgi:hypothetical protein